MLHRWLPLFLAAALLPAAAFAKGKGPDAKKASPEELVELTHHEDPGVRADAAKYLGDRKVEAGIPELVRLLQEDKDPGVRKAAINGLAEWVGNYSNSSALDAIEAAFVDPNQMPDIHERALPLLLKADATRADAGVVWHLSRYRKNAPMFTVALLKAAVKLNRQEARDLPLIIVMDIGQKRNVRVEALETLEAFQHPGLFDAYLSMITDPDKTMKIKCIQGVSRSGLPGDRVIAALTDVVRSDKQGDVRAAALKGLKFYANKGLLPLLHTLATTEKHPMAWAHAVDMLLTLADESSYNTLLQLISPQYFVSDDWTIRIIHILIRIGNPGAVPALATLRDASESDTVKVEAQRAIDLLSPERAQERLVIVQQYVPPPDVIIYDVSASVSTAPLYNLSVSVGADGTVVRADGSAIGASFSASATVQ